MQWSTPRPENPWPQEMVITVDDHSLSLNLLLFVRHAWSLPYLSGWNGTNGS
jgi:hypothetical protein